MEGISGLLAVHRHDEKPQWIPTWRRLQWPNGAVAQVFSAEEPESLRGPQFTAAWCDELAKWRQAEATFDMLQFGLRLGERPRQVITTTPRPIALIKKLIADPATALTRAGTQVNARNLAPVFLDHVLTRYGGTRLGRQEIDGEIVEKRQDALWRRAALEACRVEKAPSLSRIVVAIDPPASARKGADACGIVAAGATDNGTIYVLNDASAAGLSPQAWAMKAIALWQRLQPILVAEVNGGDMVRAVIREAEARCRSSPCADARQISARRAGGAIVRAGAGEARRRLSGAGRRDVRLRPRRTVVGAFARPARCAGVGGGGVDLRGEERAPGAGVVATHSPRADWPRRGGRSSPPARRCRARPGRSCCRLSAAHASP